MKLTGCTSSPHTGNREGKWSAMYISNHTLDRYQEHHPEATREDLDAAVESATKMDRALALTLMYRGKSSYQQGDTFLLSKDARGIFIRNQRGRVITYIRLLEQIHQILTSPVPPKVPAKKQVLKLLKSQQGQEHHYIIGSQAGVTWEDLAAHLDLVQVGKAFSSP